MKAIVVLTTDEYNELYAMHIKLREALKGLTYDQQFERLERIRGYAHYQFRGIYTQQLVDALGRHPTEDELIMLVDSGFSHFGASCTVDPSRRAFAGKVYTD